MEKSLTPRRFSQVGWGEGGSWVGRFCVKRSTAKIWFFRSLDDAEICVQPEFFRLCYDFKES